MNKLNPYESPVIPATSNADSSLRLALLLVAVVIFSPLAVIVSGLISHTAMQAFAKAATDSRPTTDPMIIITACSIFFVPPAVTLWGLTYWIRSITGALFEMWRRSGEAQQK